MDYFNALFTLFMILFPAVFTSFIRVRPGTEKQRQTGRRLILILWLVTAVTAFTYLLLARWQPAVAFYMWCAFFPLWFWLAMPLLQTRDPGWGPVFRGTRRSASLVRRDVLPAELRVGWLVITVLWGLLLFVSLLGLAPADARPVQWWLIIFNLVAGFELWLLHWSMRRSLIEPEPLADDESYELREARAGFQRFKLYGWFAFATLIMFIFSLSPLLLIWHGYDALNWAIAIGAGGGTLIGVGGGVFGTLASIKRAQINRLCIEGSPPDG